jgi:hypothetical protein
MVVPAWYRVGMGEKEDVHVRINEFVMRRVREFAKSRDMTLTAAVSVLLRLGLDEAGAGP